jgi:nitroreductase
MITLQDTLNALNARYAVKRFDPTKVLSEEQLVLIEETLRLTPSSFGLEPWKFIIVRDQVIREKLLPYSQGNKQVITASHLVVLCAKNHVGNNDVRAFLKRTMDVRGVKENVLTNLKKTLYGVVWVRNLNMWTFGLPELIFGTKIFRQWQTKQVYIALGNLLSVCAHQNIDAAPMEGFSQKAYTKILGKTVEGYTPVVLCAVGYHAAEDSFATMAKVRKTKDEVITRI